MKTKHSVEKDGHLIIGIFYFCLSDAICKFSTMLCHQGNNFPAPRLLSRPFGWYGTLTKLTSMTFWNLGKWININHWQQCSDVIWGASRSSTSVIQLSVCNTLLDQHYMASVCRLGQTWMMQFSKMTDKTCKLVQYETYKMFMWVIILTNCMHGQELCTKH